jgi:hypothetical protein
MVWHNLTFTAAPFCRNKLLTSFDETSSQVRDIKMQVGVKLPFLLNICCCSEKYDAFVRVYFDAYAHDTNPGKVIQTSPGAKGQYEFISEVS